MLHLSAKDYFNHRPVCDFHIFAHEMKIHRFYIRDGESRVFLPLSGCSVLPLDSCISECMQMTYQSSPQADRESREIEVVAFRMQSISELLYVDWCECLPNGCE